MAGRDLGGELKSWLGRTPAYCRIISICLIISYIMSWFLTRYIYLLVNDPDIVYFHYELWRCLTTPYVCMRIFQLLIMGCMFLPRAHKRERALGTAGYNVFFVLNNLIGQLVFLAMFILVYNVLPFPRYYKGPGSNAFHNGLWVTVMLEMTLHSLKNPDAESYFCCCPCAIKAKYMPWIFFVLISVFTFGPAFDILAGIILGYLHNGTSLLNWTVPSERTCRRMEKWWIFRWQKCFGNYILVDESEGEETENLLAESSSYQPTTYNQRQDTSSEAPSAPPTTGGFQSFSGKGHRLDG